LTDPGADSESLVAAKTDAERFADDRWPWLGGEALVETILWDSSRNYEAHREHLERLRAESPKDWGSIGWRFGR
jgi:hypothetical protein